MYVFLQMPMSRFSNNSIYCSSPFSEEKTDALRHSTVFWGNVDVVCS